MFPARNIAGELRRSSVTKGTDIRKTHQAPHTQRIPGVFAFLPCPTSGGPMLHRAMQV